MIPCFSVKMRTTKKKIIMSSKGPDIERLDFMNTVFKGEEGQRGGPYFCGPSGSLLSGFSLSPRTPSERYEHVIFSGSFSVLSLWKHYFKDTKKDLSRLISVAL